MPVAVREVVEEWRRAGCPRQEGIPWPRSRWLDAFPDQRPLFERLPDRLARADVRRACTAAGLDGAAAEQAFLAVMAWGYGNVGYGPWRTQRVFRENATIAASLASATATLAAEGAIAAYGQLAGPHRLSGLGPSFGTKYLYFCPQHDQVRPALILDRLVAQWLRDYTDVRVNEAIWSVRSYQRYVEQLWQWADVLNVPADVLEECIFTDQARMVGNQWA